MEEKECDHRYIHLETIKKQENEGYYDYFEKIDRFYCEKCLNYQNIKTDTWSREVPEWY